MCADGYDITLPLLRRPSRCKSVAETHPVTHSTAAFPPVQLTKICLPPPPPYVSCILVHATQNPQWSSSSCGRVCMFCVECHVVLKPHLLLALLCSAAKKKKKRCLWESAGVDVDSESIWTVSHFFCCCFAIFGHIWFEIQSCLWG